MVTGEVRSAQYELGALLEERRTFEANLGQLGNELEKLDASTKQSAQLGAEPSDADLQPED